MHFLACLSTLKFIKSLPISYLHVFSYSEREDTLAINLPNSVNEHTKAERSKNLRILSEKLKTRFYQQHLGSIRTSLFEKGKKDNYLYGFTDNYIRVKIPFNKEYQQKKLKIKLLLLNQQNNVSSSVI